MNMLQKNNIVFEQEKTFEWLRYKNLLKLDYYLPELNIAIECQGEQHFDIDSRYGNEILLFRDKLKKDLCDKHGVKIIYFSRFNHENYCLGKLYTKIKDLEYLIMNIK